MIKTHRDMRSAKTENFKFKLYKLLEFNTKKPKMPNHVTGARRNSIRDQESIQWLWSHLLSHGAGLTASKPLQVYKVKPVRGTLC